MTAYVLDTSAVPAYLWQEPGWERVLEVLVSGDYLISTVNVAELAGRASDGCMPAPDVAEMLAGLKLNPLAFDTDQAIATGLLRPSTRLLGLSLGDRACLALARAQGATALTADRSWTRLDPGCDLRVECIRPESAGG